MSSYCRCACRHPCYVFKLRICSDIRLYFRTDAAKIERIANATTVNNVNAAASTTKTGGFHRSNKIAAFRRRIKD